MIIHREYRSSSDSVVKIFDDKIEFYNLGKLPDGITVQYLLQNNYKSTPRNKAIAEFFKNLGWIEKYGSGIGRIINYFAAEKPPLPEFKTIGEGFQVSIFAHSFTGEKVGEKVGDEVGDEVGENLTANQQAILAWIGRDHKISAAGIAERIGISARKVEENIRKLRNEKIIERIGPAKGGYWKVNKQNEGN